MSKFNIYLIKALRKLHEYIFESKTLPKPECDQNPDSVSQTIYSALIDDKPCMIARIGATEMTCILNYLSINHQRKHKVIDYIKGNTFPWWWDSSIINQMQQWSGFFPAQADKIEQFCEIMIQDIPEVNILGSWLPKESEFERELASAKKVRFVLLDPFWAKNPWTKALEGKKVLVVHPFTNTIRKQYKNRELLFKNNLLPQFELKTIKAVQSIAGAETPYKDWFEALEFMKSEIDKQDYDICLIGAGAYGLPLAAHVKRMGKKGFQLGGSLQLLFGIQGKRWDKNFSLDYDYSTLINEHWVKPGDEEKPKGAVKVEGACYW